MKVLMDMPEPPAGYEYSGEYRMATDNEPVFLDGRIVSYSTGTNFAYHILRRIKPATVMVELPRYIAEELAREAWGSAIGEICKAALSKETT